MMYDEWRGSLDGGRVTMLVKNLLSCFGCRVDFHKMVGADDLACFHTHPAYAIRIILAGGYCEELEDGTIKAWLPGDVGIVKPALCHRIALLVDFKRSYSLWIRFRKVAAIQLRGDGWKKQVSA